MRRTALLVVLVAACRHAEAPAGRPAAPPTGRATTPPANRPDGDDPVVAAPSSAGLYCFSWVHLDDFSTDCFRTEAACQERRAETHAGARDVTPACERRAGGACTTIARGDQVIVQPERCFGDPGSCRRYRAVVAGNRFTTTPCAAP